MKVVICSLNSKYIHSSLAPWCLLSGIREYGRFTEAYAPEVKVTEGTINEQMSDVCARITAEKPDLIGFCSYIWNIEKVYELICLVKQELPECLIALGGPEVSYNPEEVLVAHPDVDFVLCGEGERPFAMLCEAQMQAQGSAADMPVYKNPQLSADRIPGLATRANPNAEPYTPEEIPPSPYCNEYFANLKGRISYIETSRGCPFRCAFCLSGRCGGVRFYPLERAKSEILQLANSGTQTVKFVDRTFNADRKRAREIWSFIIDSRASGDIPDGVCFHFEAAGDLFDDEEAALLKSAPVGLIQLEIGLQSFNPDTLKRINRRTDIERLCGNISRLLETGNIHIHIDLIAGLPAEDYESFKNSFNTAYFLQPHMLQLGFLKLLHGADMRENSDEFPCVYSARPPYEVSETPFISAAELVEIHAVEDAVDRLYNSGRFKRTLGYVLGGSQSASPFDFFLGFARFLNERLSVVRGSTGLPSNGLSLDEYTGCFFAFLKTIFNTEKMRVVRDLMVEDRLLTNASGKLPDCLKVYDERLKQIKRQMNSASGIAILYTQEKILYVQYDKKNPVTGEYESEKVGI